MAITVSLDQIEARFWEHSDILQTQVVDSSSAGKLEGGVIVDKVTALVLSLEDKGMPNPMTKTTTRISIAIDSSHACFCFHYGCNSSA